MSQMLSPKQVARTIGVSEASLKRWCDKGLLTSTRTAGGHRRLDVSQVMRFLRESGRMPVRPEILGLPSSVGKGTAVIERAVDLLVPALIAGDFEQSRATIQNLYLNRHGLSDICDRVMAPAFKRVGELWDSGELEVYQERRACEICLRVLFELLGLLPLPASHAPRSLGATLSGDRYHLPTAMVEVVLRESGWQASSLGVDLPAATICSALRDERPQLFWLSVSCVLDPAGFLADMEMIQAIAHQQGVPIVIGGNGLTPGLRSQLKVAACCEHLRNLLPFEQRLRRQWRERNGEMRQVQDA